jgi:hypothetical protein
MSHKYFIVFNWFSLFFCLMSSCEFYETIAKDESCGCKSTCDDIEYGIIKEVSLDASGRPYVFEAVHMYDNQGVFEYWGFDKSRNKIYLFDITSGSCIDSVSIAFEGPDKVFDVYDFHAINFDSIYLHTNHNHRLALVNRKGEIINHWSLKDILLPDGRTSVQYYLAAWPSWGVPMHIDRHGNTMVIYVHNHNFGRNKGSFPKEKYELPYLATYDLNQRDFVNLIGEYPLSYRQDDKCSYDGYFPFVINGDKVLASFKKSHCLYWYEILKKEGKFFCARSKYLPLNFDFLPYGEKVASRNEHWRTKGTYENMIHDPYHKRIYRIAVHAQPNKNAEDKLNQKSQAPWSIMALDERGRCLGEALFPASRYNFMEIFPLPEGLLISKENDFNPENKEDLISFDLIQFRF